MTQKRIIKLAFCLLTSIAGIGAYLYACGWFAPDWYVTNSAFSPEVTVPKGVYNSLFYSVEQSFNGYVGIDSDRYTEDDLADWCAYVGKAMPREQIRHLMYDGEAIDEVLQLKHSKKFTDKRAQNFLTFLEITRGNEVVTGGSYYDPWDYTNRNYQRLQNTEPQRVEALYRSLTSDAFFANRIWFQAVRLKFYSENRSSVIPFFEETAASQPKNSLYYRAMHYVAGAYIAEKHYPQANVLLAEIFDTTPELRATVGYDYRPLPDREIAQIAQKLSPSVQCALWAIQGFYTNNEANCLLKILTIDRQSPHVEFLLTRFINKMEYKLNIFDRYGDDLKSIKAYHQHARKVSTQVFPTDWLLLLAREGNRFSNPYLWKVAGGYVAMFRGEFSLARQFLQEAEKYVEGNEQKSQLYLLQAMNEVSSLEHIDAAAEKQLTLPMQRVWNNLYFYRDDDFCYDGSLVYDKYKTEFLNYRKFTNDLRYDYAFTFMRKYLRVLYQAQGNALMAELTHPKRGFFISEANYKAFDELTHNPHKTDWQALWLNYYPYTKGDIYECRGIYLFRQDRIDEALALFEKIPWETRGAEYDWGKDKLVNEKRRLSEKALAVSPFKGGVYDMYYYDYITPPRVEYTKISFLRKAKQLKDRIAQGKDVYHSAIQLGNAFCNTSFYGVSRQFYHNEIIGEWSALRLDNKENYAPLLDMTAAKKYFRIALTMATTDEQRAEAAFLLGKAERNEYFAQLNYYDIPEKKRKWVDQWEGFHILAKYPNTQYYKEAIKECGWFADVVYLYND